MDSGHSAPADSTTDQDPAPAAPAHRRAGRRPGESGSRQAILTAARARFAQHGYENTTIRGIARDANVDPALVHHFFLSKQGVFAAAVEEAYVLAALGPDVLAPGPAGMGERLVRAFLTRWEEVGPDNPLLAVIRSAMSYPESARILRELTGVAGLGTLTGGLGLPRPELRAALVGSELVGIVIMRYVIELPPLAQLPVDGVIEVVAPAVQRYLTGELPPAGPDAAG